MARRAAEGVSFMEFFVSGSAEKSLAGAKVQKLTLPALAATIIEGKKSASLHAT